MSSAGFPDAVIFDCDGLILDTEWAGYAAAVAVFEAHDKTLEVDWWRSCVGTAAGLDWHAELERLLGAPVDRGDTAVAYERHHTAFLEALGPLPGVAALMGAIVDAGIAVGVASSSPRAWVLGHLGRIGLDQHVQVVRAREDVVELKPAPEIYLSVCAALDADPERSVGLEDSAPGSLALMRAGLAAIVVPNRITRGSDFAPTATIVDSMTKVDLPFLCGVLDDHGRA